MQRLHSGAVSHVREVRQQHTLRSFEWTSAFLFSFSCGGDDDDDDGGHVSEDSCATDNGDDKDVC